eukprot:CAMPEP_0182457754 /NCGR_PEP_ID=MMETSP1319-20130603/3249_1 /TAXON_ID=172717 /ORGANISM="Bolidomonas pacifica, Strain RCC208" /LENGTH=686 /DNA_ID=CAMNT_0024656287 /DNA_START=265 /DNA_END=2325 /DNA_ORIENTATION=+
MLYRDDDPGPGGGGSGGDNEKSKSPIIRQKLDKVITKVTSAPFFQSEAFIKIVAFLEKLKVPLLSFTAGVIITVSSLFIPALSSENKFTEPVTLFSTILSDLDKTYVDPVDTKKLFETGVSAMLSSLDPYTEFETRNEAADMRESVSGRYGGVGLVISGPTEASNLALPGSDSDPDSSPPEPSESPSPSKRKQKKEIRVVNAFEGYAYDAGMRVGDKILSVNSKPVSDLTVEQVRNELRGEPGSSVEVAFERPGLPEVNKVTIERQIVKLRDVKLTTFVGKAEDAIGYIQLQGFTQDAGNEVRASITALQKVAEKESSTKKLEGLVLDLRGNPGGLLTSAVDVASLLVPKNSDIVSARGRGFPSVIYRSRASPLLSPDTKLVVLVNSGTASAAEIVSGAVQDLDVGVIVGADRTYGKGLVQNVEELPFDTALKFTVAKYFTPSGRCIQSTNYEEGDKASKNFKATSVKAADRKDFKTRAGRSIKDGGGIEVDLKVPPPKASALEVAVLRSGVLDEFAAQWCSKNEIKAGFKVTDDMYRQFQDMLAKKEASGDIPALTSLYSAPFDTLKKQLKESGYESSVSGLNNLKKSIRSEMSNDFNKFDKDIREDIANSILARYLPESMILERSLKTDAQVNAAIKLLKTPDKFDTLLARKGKGSGDMNKYAGLNQKRAGTDDDDLPAINLNW